MSTPKAPAVMQAGNSALEQEEGPGPTTLEAQRGKQAPKGEGGAPSLGRDIGFLLLKLGAIALALVLLFTFMYGLHRTTDPAMNPALRDGDLLLFYRLDKTYVASDVILLNYDGQRQARRVVAVAGDVVDITEEGLVINGNLQMELDIYEETHRYEQGVSFPLTVGAGQVFVLADAREGATDSRIYGPVDVQDTLGKVITVLRRRNI